MYYLFINLFIYCNLEVCIRPNEQAKAELSLSVGSSKESS